MVTGVCVEWLVPVRVARSLQDQTGIMVDAVSGPSCGSLWRESGQHNSPPAGLGPGVTEVI